MPLHSYTLDELVSEAHRAGNPNATRRLARSWVGLGLLDESEKGPSRGRGRGIPRYWSEHQKDLFLLLLRNQAGGARRTETLCNIPVSWWIYRGDPFVPLRQAKRALRTWFAKTRRESWQRSTHSALELIGAH